LRWNRGSLYTISSWIVFWLISFGCFFATVIQLMKLKKKSV
jgi:hypothetical protein